MTSLAFAGIVLASGHDLRLSDRGEDVFERAGFVVEWGAERAEAIKDGAALPDAPEISADLFALKVGFSTTLVHEVVLILIVALMTRQQDVRSLMRTFKLNEFSWGELWVPVVAVIGVYLLTTGYIFAVDALNVEVLEPRSNVPIEIARDPLGLALAGVIALVAAPLGEEIFFRGFMQTGFMKYGTWPAIAITAMIFAVAHLSLGAMIPFFIAGAALGWLYWRRGNLWDSIVFHFLFNATSYFILVGTR
ncbi:MAG: lysostaphin resistance A-like protein [Dehalococcoidia bacterium]